MSGIDYLLDTNFILGLLKSTPETLAWIDERQIKASQCAYSAITRMELLGYPGITPAEVQLIEAKLALLTYLPLTMKVEDIAICLRRQKVKDTNLILRRSLKLCASWRRGFMAMPVACWRWPPSVLANPSCWWAIIVNCARLAGSRTTP